MNVELNKVTRLSQLIAIVLFVGIFALGFYLGTLYERKSYQHAIKEAIDEEIIRLQQEGN